MHILVLQSGYLLYLKMSPIRFWCFFVFIFILSMFIRYCRDWTLVLIKVIRNYIYLIVYYFCSLGSDHILISTIWCSNIYFSQQIRLWESDLNRIEMTPSHLYDEFPSRVRSINDPPNWIWLSISDCFSPFSHTAGAFWVRLRFCARVEWLAMGGFKGDAAGGQYRNSHADARFSPWPKVDVSSHFSWCIYMMPGKFCLPYFSQPNLSILPGVPLFQIFYKDKPLVQIWICSHLFGHYKNVFYWKTNQKEINTMNLFNYPCWNLQNIYIGLLCYLYFGGFTLPACFILLSSVSVVIFCFCFFCLQCKFIYGMGCW